MARGGANELLCAREFPHHGALGLEGCERAEILRQHLLLAAEAPADALRKHVDLAIEQSEQVANLLLGDERRLRACADVETSVLAQPGQRPVRLQMHVLGARGRVGHLVHGVGLGEAFVHTAELPVNIDIDVVAIGDALVVQDRRVRFHGGFRVEHGRQQLVIDFELPAAFFGRGLGFRHDGGNALADEADHIVEEVGVVGIDEMILMRRGRVELARHVLPGEHGDHTGHSHGRVALD